MIFFLHFDPHTNIYNVLFLYRVCVYLRVYARVYARACANHCRRTRIMLKVGFFTLRKRYEYESVKGVSIA